MGDYRLLTKIGEGGMGVVHLAQAPDGSRVALKVLRQHVIGDDEARERLAREVASLRRVTSPRIAEVIDADPWGETPYVATRYIPGLSLHEHIRQVGPITGPDLAFLATGLAEAVIAVHQVGVLHRDIKPSNVLLEGRAPVLIDFGLARLAEDPRLTHTGWLLGTPGYLAPEILYGDDATTASDVHSWAATLVFASTGQPPFGTGPAMAVMDRVRRGEHDLSAVPRRGAAAAGGLPRTGPGGPSHHRDPALRAAAVRPARPADRPGAGPRRPDPAVRAGHARGPRRRRRHRRVRHRPPDGRLHPRRSGHARLAGPLTPATAHQPVQQAARAPYMQPPAPQQPTLAGPRGADPGSPSGRRCRGPGCGAPCCSRLFAVVVLGFARAPYLSLAAVGALTLAVRTVSWTTDSARRRQQVRGGPRWYDAPLAVLARRGTSSWPPPAPSCCWSGRRSSGSSRASRTCCSGRRWCPACC